MYKSCNTIVTLNEEHSQFFNKKGYRTVIIPNGIDIEKYTPNYSDKRYVLFGGRFSKEKGLDCLIRAYSRLKEELQREYKLVLVGSGPEKAKLQKLASKLGMKDRLNFIPWLHSEAFIKKISNCSVFVLPSLYETFGIVVLEAMALGKSVIASDIPGPQDIITHGHDGFLFEKGNAYELKKYLELCLSDKKLRTKMGKNARKTVEERYTFEKIADRYINLFEMLLEEKNEKEKA
ncbi:MAG: hypothetical protein DRI61_16895 [Chloroflexi bacterium]|nr:MAG: hypothetical protein DRI61_16895 [Chloroflexota bacterium]